FHPLIVFTTLFLSQTFHQVSTIGSYRLRIGFLQVFYYLVKSLFSGKKASANPWGSRALEWQVSSPPPLHNFHHTPVVIDGPYEDHNPMDQFQLGLVENRHDHSQTSGGTDDNDGEEHEKAE